MASVYEHTAKTLSGKERSLADYKGLTRYRQMTIDWLNKYDDGAPTSPGGGPD